MLEKSDLDAIGELIDASLEIKLEQKLAPITRWFSVIEEKIQNVEEKIDRIIKMNSEDIVVLNNEIEEIKRKQSLLESQIEKLQIQRS